MDAGFAKFLLDRKPDIFHPYGHNPRAVVPAFIAEEHKIYASQQQSDTQGLDDRDIAKWLVEHDWASGPSKARACDRPYSSRGRPYTPPAGQEVRRAWSELLHKHAPENLRAGPAMEVLASYLASASWSSSCKLTSSCSLTACSTLKPCNGCNGHRCRYWEAQQGFCWLS